MWGGGWLAHPVCLPAFITLWANSLKRVWLRPVRLCVIITFPVIPTLKALIIEQNYIYTFSLKVLWRPSCNIYIHIMIFNLFYLSFILLILVKSFHHTAKFRNNINWRLCVGSFYRVGCRRTVVVGRRTGTRHSFDWQSATNHSPLLKLLTSISVGNK